MYSRSIGSMVSNHKRLSPSAYSEIVKLLSLSPLIRYPSVYLVAHTIFHLYLDRSFVRVGGNSRWCISRIISQTEESYPARVRGSCPEDYTCLCWAGPKRCALLREQELCSKCLTCPYFCHHRGRSSGHDHASDQFNSTTDE